jgi:hypothetical protein
LIGTGFLIVGGLDFYRSLTGPEVVPIFQSATSLLHHELGGLVLDAILLLMLALVYMPQEQSCKFKILNYSIPISILVFASILSLFIIHPSFLPDIYLPGVGRTHFYLYSKILLMFSFAFCSYKFHQKYLTYEAPADGNTFNLQRLKVKYQNLAIASRLLAAVSLTFVFYNLDNDLNDQLLGILGNFLKKICGCRGTWTMGSFVKRAVSDVREQVGKGRVILGCDFDKGEFVNHRSSFRSRVRGLVAIWRHDRWP